MAADIASPIEADGHAEEPPPRRFEGWRRHSVIGAIATGMALGLKEIFQPGTIEPVITAQAPGDPPDAEDRLRVVLDPDDPTKSVAIVPRHPPSCFPSGTGKGRLPRSPVRSPGEPRNG